MTGKTKEISSAAKRLINNTFRNAKVIPMAPLGLPKQHGFLRPSDLLPTALLTEINNKWEACWPIDTLKPLVLIDLMCYLLFLKKLDEMQLIAESSINRNSYKKEKYEFNWDTFKKMDAQSMFIFFTKENGITELIKNYGSSNLRYSIFVKAPLLMNPTAKMLANVMDIIKIMEAEDSDTQAAIFDFLLHKTEMVSQNGQVYAPDYVVKLVVSLMEPAPGDVIGDPSAGNGSLLVNSAMYIADKNAAAIPAFKKAFSASGYKGIDSDLVQLRIGAMNMLLHNINDPQLACLHLFSETNLHLREHPSLIVSNLFFEYTESKIAGNDNLIQQPARIQEITFLNFILKNLNTGGRAAIIVRDIILYDDLTEIKIIRRKIIDENNLEAVITLPIKSDALFSGASILIFNKRTDATDRVWFYKMGSWKTTKRKNPDLLSPDEKGIPASISRETDTDGIYNDVAEILYRWKNKDEEIYESRTGKYFYVSVNEIIKNNYNLNFNEYAEIVKDQKLLKSKELSVTANEVLTVNLISKQEESNHFTKSNLNILTVGWLKKISSFNLKRNFQLALNKLAAINLNKNSSFSIKKLPAFSVNNFGKNKLKQFSNARQKWFSNFKKKVTSFSLEDLSAANLKKLVAFNYQRPSVIFISLLVGIPLIVIAGYLTFFRTKNSGIVSTATKTNVSTSKNIPKHNTSKMLSPEEIKAILNDTTGIIHFDEPADNSDAEIAGSQNVNTNKSVNKISRKNSVPVASGNFLKMKYTVTDTAFFHNKPDERTRRKSYLDPLNHNVLQPMDDKNGYIYIVYTNRFGRTSKGWINKKNLKKLP